jgi:hypothetical protein
MSLRMSGIIEKISHKLLIKLFKPYLNNIEIIKLTYPELIKEFQEYYKTEITELKEIN